MIAMLRRLGGVLPDGVEPRPFEVTTPDGTVVKMEGGYSPISYDPLRSKLADRKGSLAADRNTAIDPAQERYRATTTSNGSLKNRAEGYTDVVNLEWHDIARNLRDTVHDLAYREALIDINKVLTNETFADQFKRSYGPDEYSALRQLPMMANSPSGRPTSAPPFQLPPPGSMTRSCAKALRRDLPQLLLRARKAGKMSIMTQEQYGERKSSLATAISHAEGEFQSASFKELTGNGSPEETAKAKQHLDLTRAELDKVEAAWTASRAEIARLSVKGTADDFERRAAEIESLLADRKDALRAVIKAAEAAAQALTRYDDATRQIRTKGSVLAQRPRISADSLIFQITSAVGINVAATACSAILNTAHVRLTGNIFLRDAFPNGDAVAFEDKLVDRVSAAIQAAAPETEAE